MITAVILCYRRFENLERVIQSWLDQEEVTEVIVCDNSATQWKTDLPVVVLNSNKNYGTYLRYAAPLLAENELIVWGDDDIIMHPGLVADLLKVWDIGRLVGIWGRKLAGSAQYYESNGIQGKQLSEPVQVDYLCGLCILGHRRNFFDVDMMADMPKYYYDGKPFLAMGDWWWEHELEKYGVTCWIAPTDKYTNLPEQTDDLAYHRQKPLQLVREYYFRKWILGIKGEDINAVDSRLTSSS